jgi:hypothetical protein
VEDMDHPLEGSHDSALIFSKSGVGPSFILENFHERVDSMAILKFKYKGMADQFQPCLFFIALQGSVEEQLKPTTRRIVH